MPEGCAAFGGLCGCAFSIHLLLLATAGTSFVYHGQCIASYHGPVFHTVECPVFHTVGIWMLDMTLLGEPERVATCAEHGAVVCADTLCMHAVKHSYEEVGGKLLFTPIVGKLAVR